MIHKCDFACNHDPIEAIAPPVDAGSVDTEEFSALAARYGNSKAGKDYMALVANAAAWGAQQLHEGALISLKNYDVACDDYRKQIVALTERAEKAEARVKELEAEVEKIRYSESVWQEAHSIAAARIKRMTVDMAVSCDCHSCHPITMDNNRMILCSTCGNKRCPHANDHRNACTGSNEPGQAGSAYA